MGRFRSTCGQYVEDSWLAQFTYDLKIKSAEFDLWWSLHEIQSNSEKYKQLNHADMGILDFEVSNFDVSDNSGLKLIIHTPSSETDTKKKMEAFISL